MLLNIIKKELKRVFTDKRLIISTFLVPAISIYLIYTLIGTMVGDKIDDINQHRSTVYISNASESFVAYYDQIKSDLNMDVKFGTYEKADFEEKIRLGEVDLLLIFADNFDEMIQNYQEYDTPPEIKTYYNPSEEYSNEARNKFVYTTLEQYRSTLLTGRFGDISYVQAFDIDKTNTEATIMDEKKANSSVLGMIMPMLIAILLFAGAMGIGMDTIAGEKERGTMSTMLLTPVDRETIALGKVIGLGIVSIISSAFTFLAIFASLPNMMKSMEGSDLPVKLSFSLLQYAELFVVMISLVGVFVGLICLISVRARSVKEAGTYVSPIYMLIMAVAMTTMFSKSGADVALYKFAIPIYGGITAIKELFAFELSLQEFGIAVIVALACTALLIKFITKTFNDEKVMFNA